MKVIAATDKLVVIDLEETKRTPAEQIQNYIHTENGCYAPTILRVFSDYIEVETAGFDSHGSMRKKRKRVWFRDMLIMNDALYRIMHPARGKK